MFNSPIIRREIVTWFEGGPAKPLAPHAAPPSEQATPPKAITAIKPNDFGLWNNWPQHPFLPECSEGDLKLKLKGYSIFSYSDVTVDNKIKTLNTKKSSWIEVFLPSKCTTDVNFQLTFPFSPHHLFDIDSHYAGIESFWISIGRL